ncbi:MAG: 1-deoxy-D-xylulose-5-phosphate reductoisomerase [Alphaproteobacteria bacterium]|nr:1-deoxy-D-xylulose-5-phosphate reductoisomerase [Alphaproteobacteria bacterium]MBV9064013.1 1-deoxy-D-xylulose-5-phosphate reductoisomerase [Alphaproteobacteria bacterium]
MNLSALEHVACRRVTILGSTGSVGTSTLSVIEHARDDFGADAFPIEALTAQRNVDALAKQALEFRPARAVIGDETRYHALREALAGTGIDVAAGMHAVTEAAAAPAHVTMVSIVGAAGLAPALASVERGGMVALANKECVVAAGRVFRDAMEASRATIIPVDSEHNAAFQVLDFSNADAVECLTLTASGGPFRTWPRERISRATPKEAVAHPNWSMGAKISVDSATLMNKGLELIEAHHLFGLPAAKLDVVVHPQSIVHCLVSYADGSVLAHLSAPDMRTPIAVALGWPRRIHSPSPRLNLAAGAELSFEPADRQKFPCLALAEDCLKAGGSAPTVLNAANEVAVEAFLGGQIGFGDICGVVETALQRSDTEEAAANLEAVMAVDRAARELASAAILRLAA